jgi:transcriptional activator of cad operon
MNESRAMRIENWRVLPERNQLIQGKKQIKLEPRIMQVLVFLAQHPDEVVSRERILEAVWKDIVVSDEVLTNAIRELRKALGASSDLFLVEDFF